MKDKITESTIKMTLLFMLALGALLGINYVLFMLVAKAICDICRGQ